MLYILPANGVHEIAYTQLINYLNPFPITTVTYPPLLSPPPEIPEDLNWNYFSKDLNNDFSKISNAVGIGHSLGGSLLLHNALINPDRWKTIFIIEPALFSPFINKTYKLVRLLNLETYTHPMLRLTKPRREFFESKDETFKRWRNQPVFNHLSDIALENYVNASLVEHGDGYTLRFPKKWEYEIYRNMCSLDPFIWKNLDFLTAKLIVIAGHKSNTFFNAARKRLKSQSASFITIPNTTHLLPFETPLALSRIILKHL